MNQLARREVAIVSPHAGTTRDVIEVQLDLDGYPVTVIDTAGIRETDDPVEQEGVRRARARAAEADLVLWLSDATNEEIEHDGAAPVWLVRNKIDLDSAGRPMAEAVGQARYGISAKSGDGVLELIAGLVGFAQDYFGASEGGLITPGPATPIVAGYDSFVASQHRSGGAGRGADGGGTSGCRALPWTAIGSGRC